MNRVSQLARRWARRIDRVAAACALGAVVSAAGCGDEPSRPPDPELDALFGNRDARESDAEDTGSAPPDVRRDATPRPTLRDDGSPCEADDACKGGLCLPDPTWPGGTCSSDTCTDDRDCSIAEARCVTLEETPLCLARCRRTPQCRDGYTCLAIDDDGGVCVPFVDDPRGVDGEACAADEDCRGGTCLTGDTWPGGYCTTLACQRFTDCARAGANNRCLLQPDQNFCVRDCVVTDDCREGYVCRPTGGGTGFCAADVTTVVDTPDDFEIPFDLTCGLAARGGTVSIDYEVPEGTEAYMIVPFTRDGRTISPLRITGPDGLTIDFGGANRFQIIVSSLFPFINPIVVPGAPQFGAQLREGAHTLTIATATTDLCWYLVPREAPGARLDLNFYLVYRDGRTFDELRESPSLAALIEEVRTLLGSAGVTLGSVRVLPVEEDVQLRFNFLRSLFDVQELVATSRQPGPTAEDALSLNVFFISGFAIPGANGVIGISAGLPGPAGLHASPASGVAMQATFLVDPRSVGLDAVVLAHEIGHWLGLFHTTEQDQTTFDPLDDTPQCTGGFPFGCPDRTNLMFPFAEPTNVVVTAGQGQMLRAHPTVRSE